MHEGWKLLSLDPQDKRGDKMKKIELTRLYSENGAYKLYLLGPKFIITELGVRRENSIDTIIAISVELNWLLKRFKLAVIIWSMS